VASPLPLYRGTTLAVRQDAGGFWSMALAFRNDAKLRIPGAPRNFNSCGGIVLRPLLFDALYLWSRMVVSSSAEIWSWDGSESGV
jgi:hypothetical protein